MKWVNINIGTGTLALVYLMAGQQIPMGTVGVMSFILIYAGLTQIRKSGKQFQGVDPEIAVLHEELIIKQREQIKRLEKLVDASTRVMHEAINHIHKLEKELQCLPKKQ